MNEDNLVEDDQDDDNDNDEVDSLNDRIRTSCFQYCYSLSYS